jgi:hypothetical protein
MPVLSLSKDGGRDAGGCSEGGGELYGVLFEGVVGAERVGAI